MNWIYNNGILTIEGEGELTQSVLASVEKQYSLESIREVIIQGNIASIGTYAFLSFSELQKVTITAPITVINSYAFYECQKLTSITIPDTLTTIGLRAFSGCTSLISITIPDKVTSISSYTFYNCTSLTHITIPDNITIIGPSVFKGCINLTSVIIGEKVTSIGVAAFQGCTRLTNIIIPNNVTTIGTFAFSNCTRLTRVIVGKNVTHINKNVFVNCANLTNITLFEGITEIGDNAFSGCTGLSEVYYEGTEVQWSNIIINENNECLTSANIYYKLSGDFIINLSDIKNRFTIGSCAFQNRAGLTQLIIPNNVSSIGKGAFKGMNYLQKLSIPFVGEGKDSEETFGYIFDEQVPETLEEVYVTGDTEKIPNDSFARLSGIKKISLPENLKEIGAQAFQGTGIVNLIVPNLVDKLGTKCFDTESLKTISWYTKTPKFVVSNTSYDYNLYFSDTTDSKVVAYGYQGIEAHMEDSNIIYGTEPLLSTVLTYYEEETGLFYEDEEHNKLIGYAPILSRLYEGKEVSSLTGSCGTNVSYLLEPWETIEDVVNYKLIISGLGKMTDYTSENSVPWNGSKNTIKVIEINEGVSSIGSYAFFDHETVENIILPSSIEEIGREAFSGCKKALFNNKKQLEAVNLKKIGERAFKQCEQIESVNCEKSGLSEISKQAFQDCVNLKTVSFPSREIIMNTQVFQGCYNLQNLSMPMPCNVSLGVETKYSELTKADLDKVYQLYNIGGLFDLTEPNANKDKFFTYTGRIPCQLGKSFEWVEGGTSNFEQTYYVPKSFKNLTLLPMSSQLTCMPMFYLWRGDSEYCVWEMLSFKVEPKIFYWSSNTTNPSNKTSNLLFTFTDNSYGSLAGVVINCLEKTNLYNNYYNDYSVNSNNSYAISDTMFVANTNKTICYPRHYDKIICSNLIDFTSFLTQSIGEIDYTSASFTELSHPSNSNCVIDTMKLPATISSIIRCRYVKNLQGHNNGKEITIGDNAFTNLEELQNCKITSIGQKAFYNSSTTLKQVSKITGKNISIGAQAFYNCTNSVVEFAEDSSVKYIGGSAFYNCKNWDCTINCPEEGMKIAGEIRDIPNLKFSYKKEEGAIAINNGEKQYYIENVNRLYVKSNVTEIVYQFCANLENLTFVWFEGEVSRIAAEAFKNCINLTSVFLPTKVSDIDTKAFYNCRKLISITIPEDTRTIYEYAFADCIALTRVIIPKNVKEILNHAFYDCTNLTTVNLPSGMSYIGQAAFAGCNLINVRIPSSVSDIGYGAFYNYKGEWIEIPYVGTDPKDENINSYAKVLGALFDGASDPDPEYNSIIEGGHYSNVGHYYSVPNNLKQVYVNNSDHVPFAAFYNWNTRTTNEGLNHVYFKYAPNNYGYSWNTNSGIAEIESYPPEEDLPWNQKAVGYSRGGLNNILECALTSNACLYLNYNKEYLWDLKLFGKQYDVYITDNNTYAEEYSFLPTVYVPNHSGLEVGQHIDIQGENTYLISDIKQFKHTGSVFYRQSKGILNGKINYYSVNSGTLTYVKDTKIYEIDSTLREQLTETPVDFASDVEYSIELHKGTICKIADEIIVTLEEGISPEFFEFGQTISLKKSLITTASLDVALLNAVKEGTQFVVANSNQIQTVNKIDELYNISFSPGFYVSSSGYTETQITLADKTLILPSDIKNTEAVIVVNKKGTITIMGDLEEEIKKCKIEEHLLSLITINKEDITKSTYFKLDGIEYYFTQIDVKNQLAYFETKNGQGYVIPNQVNFEYEIVLQNEQDLKVMDTTDLHLTLNYINVFEIESIKEYEFPSEVDFGLEEGEMLYLVDCKEVVNATNYEVNTRNLEKEAVIERYSTILTVETLEGATPQSIIIPPNTSYTVYSNNIKTPAYYFESKEKQPLIITCSGQPIIESLVMNSGSALFEANYEGSVLTCTWSLYEYYKGDYIQINQVVNQYSPNLFYNYHLFEDKKQYKLSVQILTKEGLIINKEIDIDVQHEVQLEILGLSVEKDCVQKALVINLTEAQIKITGLETPYKICPRSWLDDKQVPYKIKELYVIRKNKDDNSENTVLTKVQGFPYYIYDYSFNREDNYEYSVIPVFYNTDIEEQEPTQYNLMRGVPSKITGEDHYNVKNIVIIGTKLDLRENTQETEVLPNNYEVDFEKDSKWYFTYNTDARNVTIVTDKNTYESISPYATVNYTNRNYKSGTVTAFLGSFHKEGEILNEWTYKDSIRLQNKFQKFANNGKIKMLRDEIGNVIPVDITLKSFEYNSHSKPTNITVTFDWVQVGEESKFIVYEADYNIPTKGANQ